MKLDSNEKKIEPDEKVGYISAEVSIVTFVIRIRDVSLASIETRKLLSTSAPSTRPPISNPRPPTPWVLFMAKFQ